ncbi:MAG: site-2 protease family protein [Opitutales bacterium]|nr:site-2 protease family protein [Opitutales bacterium]
MNVNELQGFFGDTAYAVLAFVFFCASILIHEYGHFVAARWRGLVVERFSIGFGPRLFGWKRNGVDYRFSAIPLGGYVALPQLAGVSTLEGTSEHDGQSLPPISSTDKIIVSVAGPLFNVLFALLLGLIIWVVGKPVDASMMTTTVGYAAREVMDADGEWVSGPAREAGVLPGDRIISIDGTPVNEWTDIVQAVATSSGYDSDGSRSLNLEISRAVELERDGQIVSLSVKPILGKGTGLREIGILPLRPAVVGSVFENSPAEKAGLQSGDRIVAVDGERIGHILAAGRIISKTPPEPHTLSVQRGGEIVELTMTPVLVDDGSGNKRPMIGIRWGSDDKVIVHQDPITQVSGAIYMTFDVLKALLNPKSDVSVKDMSGPVGIAHALFISAREGVIILLFFVLFINVNLAIVNLLPIPVLDGGHICFAFLEKLFGKPVPQRIIANSQALFVLLFLGAMAYITMHDIIREVDMAGTRKEIRAAEKQPDPVFSQEAAGGASSDASAESASQTAGD